MLQVEKMRNGNDKINTGTEEKNKKRPFCSIV